MKVVADGWPRNASRPPPTAIACRPKDDAVVERVREARRQIIERCGKDKHHAAFERVISVQADRRPGVELVVVRLDGDTAT